MGLTAGLCLLLPADAVKAAPGGGNWFYEQLNPYTGAWKGRGFGRRKNSEEKEVVSCKGTHNWLKKGREFEQRYTCWGGDFAVSGAFRIRPGKTRGDCIGEAINGAGEVIGKIWGKIKPDGALKVNMKKNFSKTVNQASLTPKKNGRIVYSVMAPVKEGGGTREILNITYKKLKGKKAR
ncbi:MAG: hypothetical protein C0605_00990 [Hyphomicrobiales bacterium]|nr:MAG: hypothetical protein C0605_00990 [Hyphomicrobiales bacterium]